MIRSLPTLSGQRGVLAGPLIVSIFSGLILLVVLYPLLMGLRPFGPDRNGFTVLFSTALFLCMAGIYRLGVRYKKRRFAAGSKDPILMRTFMKKCLKGDLEHLLQALETFKGSNQRLFFNMLLSKAEEIAQSEGLHLPGIDDRLPSAGREKRKRRFYRRLFQSSSEYENSGLPDEIVLLKKASEPLYDAISRLVSELIEKRKDFFTLMGDYQDLLPAPEAHTYVVLSTPKSASVPPDSTRKIAFVLNLLDILDDVETDRIEPNRKKELLRRADRRLRMIETASNRYQEAWKALASAYERMPST